MPWEPLPDGTSEPRPVREGLDAVLHRLAGADVSTIETVMDSWDTIVGEQLAALTAPVKIDGATLTVRTDDPVVASEIRWMERAILDQVARLSGSGELRSVAVVVRPPRRRGAVE